VDVTVGDDFLGLCDQKWSSQHGSCSKWLWCWVLFNSCNCTLVNCMICSLAQALFQALNGGYVNKFQAYCLHMRALCPSCCGWRWHFQKPALSTGELKRVPFVKW